jgi:O-antigen ligase
MTGLAVLGAWSIVTAWLLWRDTRERPSVPPAAWLAVAWAVICSSRSVTSWFGDADPLANRDEGNLAEATIYVALIVGALLALTRRDLEPSAVIRDNSWLFVFYLFWCTSVLWADSPFITLKRLIKDLGHVVMALLVLTSRPPGDAVKAVFIRSAYVCVPLSIVLIRYFPDVSRSYVGYHSNQLTYLGVAGHKNGLGMLAAMAAVVLLWDLLDVPRTWGRRRSPGGVGVAVRCLVLAMAWYLLLIVDSATSLVCATFASLLIAAVRLPFLQRAPGRLEGHAVAGALLVWSVDSLFNLKAALVQRLGRDMTLTTRTDIWQTLVNQHDSPLLGAGFDSFWTGQRFVEVGGSFGGIIQAHNGYLETFLNGGYVGVGLLGILLVWGYARVRRALSLGTTESGIRLVFLLLAIVHNVAEASFNKVSILWFAAVLAIMECRGPDDAGSADGGREPLALSLEARS